LGAVVCPRKKLHEMLVALTVRQLNKAQPIALVDEAHRLGIDGNIALKRDRCGKIPDMQMNSDKSLLK